MKTQFGRHGDLSNYCRAMCDLFSQDTVAYDHLVKVTVQILSKFRPTKVCLPLLGW